MISHSFQSQLSLIKLSRILVGEQTNNKIKRLSCMEINILYLLRHFQRKPQNQKAIFHGCNMYSLWFQTLFTSPFIVFVFNIIRCRWCKFGLCCYLHNWGPFLCHLLSKVRASNCEDETHALREYWWATSQLGPTDRIKDKIRDRVWFPWSL